MQNHLKNQTSPYLLQHLYVSVSGVNRKWRLHHDFSDTGSKALLCRNLFSKKRQIRAGGIRTIALGSLSKMEKQQERFIGIG